MTGGLLPEESVIDTYLKVKARKELKPLFDHFNEVEEHLLNDYGIDVTDYDDEGVL